MLLYIFLYSILKTYTLKCISGIFCVARGVAEKSALRDILNIFPFEIFLHVSPADILKHFPDLNIFRNILRRPRSRRRSRPVRAGAGLRAGVKKNNNSKSKSNNNNNSTTNNNDTSNSNSDSNNSECPETQFLYLIYSFSFRY